MYLTRVLRVLLLLGFLLSGSVIRAYAVPTLSIVPSGQTVFKGQSLSLDITVSDITDLYAFQFDLAFNPAFISTVSIAEGAFLLSVGTTAFIDGVIDNVGGTISSTAGTLVGEISGASGSGILASITFQADALGTSNIALSNVIFQDSNLVDITPTITQGGAITVIPANVPEPTTLILIILGLASGCFFIAGGSGRQI